MTAQEKILAAMEMLRVIECEYMTHRQKTVLVQIAYRMLREGINQINKYVFNDGGSPF